MLGEIVKGCPDGKYFEKEYVFGSTYWRKRTLNTSFRLGRKNPKPTPEVSVKAEKACDSLFLGSHLTDLRRWTPDEQAIRRWWDPISPIRITNHVRHLHNTFAIIWDDSRSRTTKDDKGRHTLRPFAMSYTILQYSTVLPCTFATFSNLFWRF